MNSRWSKLVRCLLLACCSSVASAQTPDVQVNVYGIHFGGQVVYRYQVVNNSSGYIGAVDLGVAEPGKDLPAAPWDTDPSFTDVPTLAPTSKCKPFQGMVCYVSLYQFDYMPAPRSTVQMRANTASVPTGVSSVAEITVPQAQSGYLTGTAAVRFNQRFVTGSDGKPIVEFQTAFTKGDTTPPTLSGTTTTAKKGTMLAVTVSLAVDDNIDPAPAVVLASVTSNQQMVAGDVSAVTGGDTRSLQVKPYAGRIYYLTYTATDGSDNTGSTVIAVSASK